MSKPRASVSVFTATCLVVANMIGTGVFTSLGFQLVGLDSGFGILALWLLGGVCALCGALCYAELAAALPRSGGEYHLIGRTLHPAAGFFAGCLSATVGFAAPVALAAMAFGKYVSGALGLDVSQPAALAAVTLVTLVHLRGVRAGAIFQDGATVFKLALVVVVLVVGWLAGNPQHVVFAPASGDGAQLLSASFATNLVYVMYAYTGWNAATYIVGEIREPARNVPRALVLGTVLVATLYVGLNAIFLRTTPADEMRGQLEVGLIAGGHIFGAAGGRVLGGFICFGLIASISAMTWIGPRVAATMGEDLAVFCWATPRERGGVPVRALLVQALLVGTLIVTSSFDPVLNYIQFSLTLCSMLAVTGLLVLRWREPALARPFRVPLYPLTPLVFLAVSGWMLAFMLLDEHKRQPSLIGLATVAAGLLVYFLSPKSNP